MNLNSVFPVLSPSPPHRERLDSDPTETDFAIDEPANAKDEDPVVQQEAPFEKDKPHDTKPGSEPDHEPAEGGHSANDRLTINPETPVDLSSDVAPEAPRPSQDAVGMPALGVMGLLLAEQAVALQQVVGPVAGDALVEGKTLTDTILPGGTGVGRVSGALNPAMPVTDAAAQGDVLGFLPEMGTDVPSRAGTDRSGANPSFGLAVIASQADALGFSGEAGQGSAHERQNGRDVSTSPASEFEDGKTGIKLPPDVSAMAETKPIATAEGVSPLPEASALEEQRLPLADGPQRGSSDPARGPALALAPQPQTGVFGISRLLAQVHTLQSGGPVEVTVPSADIGALRMEIVTEGANLKLLLMVERPETEDLVRRNLEQLRSELAGLGFSSADLSFGSWKGSRPGGDTADNRVSDIFQTGPDEGPAYSQPADPFARARMIGGLDLRL